LATYVFVFTRTAENSGGTASASLLFRFAEPSQPRISAEDEMPMAVNLLQKTAKTARSAIGGMIAPTDLSALVE
jgi:hypothetical protein